MSDSLKESIKSGQMKLPTSASDWKKALKLQSMVDEAKKSGKKIPESVSKAMADGNYDKGIDKMEKSIKKSTDKASKAAEKAASKGIGSRFEKSIKAIQKKANKNPVKFKGDAKDINKIIAQTNKKKLNDKTSKLKGNLKDAVDKIKTVNSKRLNSKTSNGKIKQLGILEREHDCVEFKALRAKVYADSYYDNQGNLKIETTIAGNLRRFVFGIYPRCCTALSGNPERR